MDDDGIIMSVYDDIHEELKAKNKAIDKLKTTVSKVVILNKGKFKARHFALPDYEHQ